MHIGDIVLLSAGDRDVVDHISHYRDRFYIPYRNDRECLYFCGNSLGLQPKAAKGYLLEELDKWRTQGVDGHFAGRRPWKDFHEPFAPHFAQLVGADLREVVCMNSLTVNLHLLMVSFFRPTAKRHKLIMEKSAFPSDRYAVESQMRFHGLDPDSSLIEVGPRKNESLIRNEDLSDAIQECGDELCLVLLPGVQYLSGQVLDIPRLTSEAHAVGAIAGWDLAHAAGNIPLQLHDWNVDFAVWCTYKYLNGGPGAVAGAFVHARHGDDGADTPRFAGWWGHDKQRRFKMESEFHPIPGAEGWQISNPPVLGMAALLASLEMFSEVGMPALRRKSVALTGYLETLLTSEVRDAVEILTPTDPNQRGCQLSLRLRDGARVGRRVFERLGAAEIICDWREPDVVRVAPTPLYNRFSEVERFVELLTEALK